MSKFNSINCSAVGFILFSLAVASPAALADQETVTLLFCRETDTRDCGSGGSGGTQERIILRYQDDQYYQTICNSFVQNFRATTVAVRNDQPNSDYRKIDPSSCGYSLANRINGD